MVSPIPRRHRRDDWIIFVAVGIGVPRVIALPIPEIRIGEPARENVKRTAEVHVVLLCPVEIILLAREGQRGIQFHPALAHLLKPALILRPGFVTVPQAMERGDGCPVRRIVVVGVEAPIRVVETELVWVQPDPKRAAAGFAVVVGTRTVVGTGTIVAQLEPSPESAIVQTSTKSAARGQDRTAEEARGQNSHDTNAQSHITLLPPLLCPSETPS